MVSDSIQEKEAIHDLLQDAPILREKIIVDVINGLEVSEDHIHFRSKRGSFFQRMWDGLNGNAFDRQQQIDEHLQHTLQSTSMWLQYIQQQQLETYRAVTQVSQSLSEAREGMKKLIISHLSLRDRVAELEEHIYDVVAYTQRRQEALQDELLKIGLRQSAAIHMERVFDSWKAKRKYQSFPPLLQLVLVLEELYWSPFAQYDAVNHEFREQLCDKCVIQLRELTGLERKQLVPTFKILESIRNAGTLQRQGIQYIVSNENEKAALSSLIELGAHDHVKLELSPDIPRVFSIARLSKEMIEEIGGRLCG